MTGGEKKLTEAPTNLKEAIDWVLRVSGRDSGHNEAEGIKGLAEELHGMLNGDPGGVREEVEKKFGEVSKTVMQKLKEATSNNKLNNSQDEGLDPFLGKASAAISREKAEQWVSKVPATALETLIKELVAGLETLVTPGSGIVQGSYTSAYGQTNDKWESLQASERRECAIILLAILPLLQNGGNGWKNQSLSGGQGLQKYMEALGYENKLNSKIGETIVSNIMNSMFSGELKTAYGSSKPHYPEFLKALQNKAITSIDSPSSPLTSLYLLSYYYITYPLYDVRSTSPVAPSFAGYSGTAALASGAYGFNLGGLGTFMSALLA
ncbi:variant erythrocyte surface antigen-1 family protein [Babesia caballi]|uniref:Variant erythrocyte surface antigen-1 family protein n=1 Tax=Babesia caballi TaxID=5871 RepID=A0AAV4LYS7_BABCB|nr:variant erythrocyte surface antigen-1 family protein [Babesia caballi]